MLSLPMFISIFALLHLLLSERICRNLSVLKITLLFESQLTAMSQSDSKVQRSSSTVHAKLN